MSFSISAGALVHIRNMDKKAKEDEKRLESVVVRFFERDRRSGVRVFDQDDPSLEET